jgi:hypothetical protein
MEFNRSVPQWLNIAFGATIGIKTKTPRIARIAQIQKTLFGRFFKKSVKSVESAAFLFFPGVNRSSNYTSGGFTVLEAYDRRIVDNEYSYHCISSRIGHPLFSQRKRSTYPSSRPSWTFTWASEADFIISLMGTI